MSVLSPSNLETIDYRQQGWSAIVTANAQKLNTYLIKLWGPIEATSPLGSLQVADETASQSDPAGPTAQALTDSSGGTPTQTVKAVSGSGADADINDNFASLTDEIEKLRADNAALKTALEGTIDYCDALKAKVNGLLTALRKTGGCGVLDNQP